MKRTRSIAAAAVIAISGLLTGVAWAGGRQPQVPLGSAQGKGLATACAAMHDSPAMERMHQQMPPAMQAQCDAMHAQQMGSGMTGSGMMGSSAMMGDPSASTSMTDHHPGS